MKPKSKWVQFAFRDSFSKEKSKSQNSFDQASKSRDSSLHSFTIKQNTENESHCFSQVPSSLNFYTRSAVCYMSPSVDGDDDDFRKQFDDDFFDKQQNAFKKSPKLQKMSNFQKISQQKNCDQQLRFYLDHLKKLERQIEKNRRQVEKLFRQQQQTVKVVRTKLIDVYSKKQKQIKDSQLKEIIKMRQRQRQTEKTKVERKTSGIKIAQIKSQKQLMIAKLRQKVKKKGQLKKIPQQKKSQPYQLEASHNFGKIFTTLNEMKVNLQQIQSIHPQEKMHSKNKSKPKYTAVQAKIHKAKR